MEDLRAALMQIAEESQKEEEAKLEISNSVLPEKPHVCEIDKESHLNEIELLTKKAELARKASLRKIKKEDHSKGYYDKLSAKDKIKKQAMQKNIKTNKKK